ncbi:MAG: sigma-70 family RNA polymerase sigma factor [Byssovorax sp.]
MPTLTPEQKERMEAAMPMVDRRARWMARRRPALTFGQYQSLGYEALWRAVLTFDASRGARFGTYAWLRCCGAMRDGLREHTAQDPLRRACQVFGITALSSFEANDDPFGETDEGTFTALVKHCRAGLLEMETIAGCATWREQGEDGLVGHVARAYAVKELESARGALEGEEAEIVALRFDADLAWAQVAETLGLSESTVKRRAAVVREKLRRELLARGVGEHPA